MKSHTGRGKASKLTHTLTKDKMWNEQEDAKKNKDDNNANNSKSANEHYL